MQRFFQTNQAHCAIPHLLQRRTVSSWTTTTAQRKPVSNLVNGYTRRKPYVLIEDYIQTFIQSRDVEGVVSMAGDQVSSDDERGLYLS